MTKTSLPHVGILIDPDYGSQLSASITLLQAEFERRGYPVHLYRTCDMSSIQAGDMTTMMHKGEDFSSVPGILINRHNVLNCTGHDIQMVQLLEDAGAVTLNEMRHSLITHDKYQLDHLLLKNNVPLPPMARLAQTSDLTVAAERLGGFPLVIKANTSNQGKGVMYTPDLMTLRSVVDFMWHEKHEFYVQKFIPEAAENCYRAVVIDGEAVTIYGRLSPVNEFRSNLKDGSFGGFTKAESEEAEIFLKLHNLLKLEVLGIDFARTPQGMQIIEVNAYPGLAQIYNQTKLDLSPHFCKSAINKYSRENRVHR